MIEEPLIKAAIQLEKLLGKLQVKHKYTVVTTSRTSYRVDLFRTDVVSQTLKSDDYAKVSAIFKPLLGVEVAGFEGFLELLGILTEKGLALRLERPPQVVKEELRKWPEKMLISSVA